MTFASPHLLWLILLPFAWLAWDLLRRRRASDTTHPKILRAEAGSHSLQLSALSSSLSASSPRVRPWLCLGLALAVVALARPQWGRLEEPVFDQSREILIAIDLSRSMLSPDVKPSRLDRAKLLTQSLLEKLTGERVGLVVFSGTAFLQSPLSADYEILREFLPALNPDFLPEGGTNYQALIDTSLSAFGSTTAADRFLVILSDGEATDDHWRDRIPDLKKKGIRVLGLGVGTAAGAMIPDGSGGLVKDERGAVVLSKLENKTLQELADATNGVYQDASSWIDLAALINTTVDAGKKGDFLEKNTIRLVERFQWPLALALWFLLVSFYYEFPVRPKPRDIKLTGPDASRGTGNLPVLPTAALLLLVAPAFFFTAPPVRAAVIPAAAPSKADLSAAGPAKAEDIGPQLGKIYARLANQDRLSAQDYAEVARETLRWGKRFQENGQPVLPGPVHDAIEAVDRLIAMDSKIADWTKLRAELEDLLKKPDEQKQDKKDQKDQQDKKDQKDQPQDKQNQDQSKQDQKNQDQQKQDQSQKQDQQQKQQQDQSKPGESKDQKSDAQKKNDDQNSAFGDMKDRKQPPPPPQDSQKVGGVPEKKPGEQPPPTDPQLALPLQKLDQLRNQDSPAELFELMQGEKQKGPPKSPGKNW